MISTKQPNLQLGHLLIWFGIIGTSLAATILLLFPAYKLFGIKSLVTLIPASAMIVLPLTAFFMRQEGFRLSETLKTLGAFLLSCVLSVWAAGIFFDSSYDGRFYHQEAVIQLKNGFDPHRETLPDDSIAGGIWSIASIGDPSRMSQEEKNFSRPTFWLECYPKATELFGASVYALTGEIESGKMYNIFFLICTLALVCGTSMILFPSKPGLVFAFAAGIGIFSPIVINQLWTYYIDGIMHLLLICHGVFLILFATQRRTIWLVAIGTTFIILVNLKFTGLINGMAYTFFAFLFLASQSLIKDATRLVVGTSVAVGVAVMMAGYHPYVRNLLEHGHPLHPLMGKGKMDIITPNAFPEFVSQSKLTKFAYSLLGPTSQIILFETKFPPVKIPLSIQRDEIRFLAYPDARIAGFGPYFAPFLLAGLIYYLTALTTRMRRVAKSMHAKLPNFLNSLDWIDWCIIAISATSFINPEMWWARYVPQMWLLPPLFCLSGVKHLPFPHWRLAALVAGCVYLVPIVWMTAFLLRENAIFSLKWEQDLQLLKEVDGHQVFLGQMVADRVKFLDRGIPLNAVPISAMLSGKFQIQGSNGEIIAFSDPRAERKHSNRPELYHPKSLSFFLQKRVFWIL